MLSHRLEQVPLVGETLAPKVGIKAAEKMHTPAAANAVLIVYGKEAGVRLENIGRVMRVPKVWKAFEGLSYAKKLKTLLRSLRIWRTILTS